MKVYIIVFKGPRSGDRWPSMGFPNFYLTPKDAQKALDENIPGADARGYSVREFTEVPFREPVANVVSIDTAKIYHDGPSISELYEAELEPRHWDGNTIGPVLRHGRE